MSFRRGTASWCRSSRAGSRCTTVIRRRLSRISSGPNRALTAGRRNGSITPPRRAASSSCLWPPDDGLPASVQEPTPAALARVGNFGQTDGKGNQRPRRKKGFPIMIRPVLFRQRRTPRLRVGFQLRRLLLGPLTLPLLFPVGLAAQPVPDKNDPLVAQVVCQFLQQGHVTRPVIGDATSKRLFQRFLKDLDPNKGFFLRSDIDAFKQHE